MADSNTIKTLFGCDTVYTYFLGITQRDHPSANQNPDDGRNEDPVRAYVIQEAEKIENTQVVYYEPQATEPGKRDIVLRRSGSGTWAQSPPIMLQAHMDMVCNPDDMAFPLTLSTKEEDGAYWLQANEKGGSPSTLGADDGIGVATALALLVDQDLAEYPVECIFTVQEETNMGGAQGFDIRHITGNQLLNLDSENLTEIIYGSAGGCDTTYTRNGMSTCVPENQAWIKLGIKGLKGGHSGIEIGKNRLNAIKGLAQFLAENLNVYAPYLCSFERLDSKTDNSIPAEAQMVVGVPADKAQHLMDAFKAYAAQLVDEAEHLTPEQYFAEPLAPAQWETLDRTATEDFAGILTALPAGVVLRENQLVITSTNLFKAEIDKQEGSWDIEVGSSNRSSESASFDALIKQLVSTGERYGFKVAPRIDSYPMWQPDDSSPLLAIAKDVYKAMYGKACEADVIHAGLECAVFVQKYKDAGKKLQAVSLGPTIRNPHTPSENLLLQSADGKHPVKEFYGCVKAIIEKVMAEQD